MDAQEQLLQDFKKELKALLKKYDATIGMDAADGSDWYGITGEYIQISIGNKFYFLTDGASVWEGDL